MKDFIVMMTLAMVQCAQPLPAIAACDGACEVGVSGFVITAVQLNLYKASQCTNLEHTREETRHMSALQVY